MTCAHVRPDDLFHFQRGLDVFRIRQSVRDERRFQRDDRSPFVQSVFHVGHDVHRIPGEITTNGRFEIPPHRKTKNLFFNVIIQKKKRKEKKIFNE